MNPRERVLKAMNRELPDRVPLMCQFSIGFMNQQLKGSGITPMELWLDPEKYAEALIILRDIFHFDGILVSVHGHFSEWRMQIKKLEEVEGMEIATFKNRTESYPADDLPFAQFIESRKKKIDDVSPEDIFEELDYIPASDNCCIFIDKTDPYHVFDILNEKVKSEYSIHGEVSSPFDYLLDLLGYENALTSLLLMPGKCKSILQKFTTGVIKMSEDLCEKNIDAIKISSPFAGMGFISPELYKEFELPYISQVTRAIKGLGKHVYLHTCGHINDRLEIMRDSGITGLECLDPPPIGDVELEEAFKRVGKDVFIKGNIDSVNSLLNTSEEKLMDDVLRIIKTGKINKGFILSTACSIAPGVTRDRICLIHSVVEKYGYY